MFKKLKDKIAEEVKQSPLKSVQQLASAVVSPSSSSVFEPSSNDHFCIDDEDEDNQETPKNSPARAGGFTTVNLQGQASTPLDTSYSHESTRSRRSSTSSVTSDASSFFQRYEPSSVNFHLQSDLESASEVEDSLSAQLEHVSKENLYEAYRKLRMRYNKYKGRFVDLADHYRRLEKENIKCKNILSESQDKALRRISELREQCTLEQEAKAHLEEALRSDLEEKDHLINTLNTKVELLKKGEDVEPAGVESNKPETKNLMDFPSDISDEQISNLKEKVKKLEGLLGKCKTSITEKNESIEKLQKELTSIENLHSQRLTALTGDLKVATNEIDNLRSTVETLKKNEEEAALSLAENKLTIHRELEVRDEQLKVYKNNIEEVSKEKDDLLNKVTQLQHELKAASGAERDRAAEDERADLLQELSRGKSEAVKLMQQKLVTIEQNFTEKLNSKEDELNKLSQENETLKQKVITFEKKVSSIETRASDSKIDELNNSVSENNAVKIETLVQQITELENRQKNELLCKNELENRIAGKEKEIEELIKEQTFVSEQKVKEINVLKDKLNEYKEKCDKLQELYKGSLNNQETLNKHALLCKENSRKEIESKELKFRETVEELEKIKSLCVSKDEEILKLIGVKDLLSRTEKDLNGSRNVEKQLKELLSNKQKELDSAKIVYDAMVIEKSNTILNLEKQIDELNNKIQHQNVKIENISRSFNDLQDEKLSLETKLSSGDIDHAKLIESLKEDKLMVEKQLKDAENNIVCLENEMKLKEEMLIEKQTELSENVLKLEEYKKGIHSLQEEINGQNKKLSEYYELDSKISSFGKIIVNANAVLNNSINNTDNSHKNAMKIPNNFHNLQEEGQILIMDITKLKHNLRDKESTLELLSKELSESKMVASTLQKKISQLEYVCESCSLEKQAILQKVASQRTVVADIKKSFTSLASSTKTHIADVEIDLGSLIKQFSLVEGIVLHKKENDAYSRELDIYKQTISKLKSDLEVKESAMQDHNNIKNELKSLKNSNLLFEEENFKLNETITNFESEVSSLKNGCVLLEEKLLSENNKFEELQTKLKQCLKQLDMKIKEVNELQKEKSTLKERENEIYAKLEESVNKNDDLQQKLEIKESQLDSFINEKSATEKNQKDVLQTKTSEILHLKNELTSIETTLKNEIDLKESLIQRKEMENQKMNETLDRKCHEMESKYMDQEYNISQLEEEVSKLNTFLDEKEKRLIERENDNESIKVYAEELQTFISNILQIDRSHSTDMQSWNENFNKKISEEISKACAESLSKITSLTTSISMIEKEKQELETGLTDFRIRNEALQIECQSLIRDKAQLNEEVYVLRNDQLREIPKSEHNQQVISDLQIELESIRKENFDLRRTYEKNNENLSSLHRELSTLKMNNAKLQEVAENNESRIDVNFEKLQKELNLTSKENEELISKLKDTEEKQAEKIKQLVFEFNIKLAEKDEEVKEVEDKKFDRREAEDNFLYAELKQQIKDMQQQLETRDDVYEKLLEDNKEEKRNTEELLSELKRNHEREIREQDKKWRACLDRRLLEAELKYKEEVDELSKEWKAERKQGDTNTLEENTHNSLEELECSNRLAVAAVGSGASSGELLRKQVTALTKQLEEGKHQHKREVAELQRLLTMKKRSIEKEDNTTVEDCTEMEYLRNILFEYMMGKEPIIMAKVLSAIVKFDPEQTNKILQKEEQKVSLLGKVSSLIPKD